MPTTRLGYNELMDTGKIVFRSNFEGGNCWRVERTRGVPAETIPSAAVYEGYKPSKQYDLSRASATAQPTTTTTTTTPAAADVDIYELWLCSDCMGTEYEAKARGWFQFTMENVTPGERVVLRIMNGFPHEQLYLLGMQPVWRYEHEDHNAWQRIVEHVTYTGVAENAVLDIPFTFDTADTVRLCFTYPYPLTQLKSFMEETEAKLSGQEDVHYTRRVVTQTLEGHDIEELTLTHKSNARYLEGGGEGAPQIVFFSARVHPCESPASHILEGALRLITENGQHFDDEPHNTDKLLKKFIFKIVPMINPDGVNRGHSRSDSLGRNLNRYYAQPLDDMPSPAAVRNLILEYNATNRLFCYIDMHAHHSKRGLFFYGNHHPEVHDQIESQLFPLMISKRNTHYDFNNSNFSQKNMTAAGGKDGSKEGSARVSLFQASGLKRCYTMEVNYNTSTILSMKGAVPPKYTPLHYHEMGRDIVLALLDVVDDTEATQLGRTELKKALAEKDSARKEGDQRRSSIRAKVDPAFLKAQGGTGGSGGFVVM